MIGESYEKKMESDSSRQCSFGVVYCYWNNINYSQPETQDEQNNPSQINRQNKDARNGLAEINRRNKNIPVADFDELLPSNIAERTKREKKKKAGNMEEYQPGDAKRFMLTEERDSFYGSPETPSYRTGDSREAKPGGNYR